MRRTVKQPIRRLLAGLAIATAAITGTLIAAPQQDTAWGAPDTTTAVTTSTPGDTAWGIAPADTAWGNPPTAAPYSDTAWG